MTHPKPDSAMGNLGASRDIQDPAEDGHQSAMALRNAILDHLEGLDLDPSEEGQSSKDKIRARHLPHRYEASDRERRLYERSGRSLLDGFASGDEVDPERISVEIVPVKSGTVEGDLFRIATLLWSVPVSRGYGRRMRFLIRDRQNEKLIGLLAIGSPVFNLQTRDAWVGWDVEDRRTRLTSVMDAYVAGAVPPYSQLIGGKLVTSMLASSEIGEAFKIRYSGRAGLISGEVQHPHLVLVTTTSSLGRSSQYNRLKLNGLLDMERIGETSGWGHFHIPESLFRDMRTLLEGQNHKYATGHQFGSGPNWRMRVVREALEVLDLDPDVLKHGIRREVFGLPLAANWREYLTGHATTPTMSTSPASVLAEAAKARWVVPRGERRPEFRGWTIGDTQKLLERHLDGPAIGVGLSSTSLALAATAESS